ncbi:hypothetical protein KM92DES2_10822 [uncultured Desulfovibrio sp.]|uniref:Uncharacterized protein n=1 Tax=uncultured Desulfovibrio sp. TaxID=167968 RepID=A0A212JB76_9BACT|nr:hypothetical protein KM92DES2_10822 [uncultured Desulfovibrio sp.]
MYLGGCTGFQSMRQSGLHRRIAIPPEVAVFGRACYAIFCDNCYGKPCYISSGWMLDPNKQLITLVISERIYACLIWILVYKINCGTQS